MRKLNKKYYLKNKGESGRQTISDHKSKTIFLFLHLLCTCILLNLRVHGFYVLMGPFVYFRFVPMLLAYKSNYSKWFSNRDREKRFAIKRHIYMVLHAFDLRKNVHVSRVHSKASSPKLINKLLNIIFFFL